VVREEHLVSQRETETQSLAQNHGNEGKGKENKKENRSEHQTHSPKRKKKN
jgi:hypothetical protein